jgi:polyisoprenoid-binding protein YceI
MRIVKLIGLSFAFLGLGLAAVAQDAKPAVPAGEKIYLLDTNHSTIGFAAPILGMSEVTGKFTDFTGRIVVPDETDLTKANVEVAIKTASINSGIADRDKHLRTVDFFDAEKYPEITFKSKKIQKVGNAYAVVGDFTMRGVTKELTIPFELTGHAKTLGARATFPLNRKDYGVSWSRVMDDGSQFVSDVISIELRLLTRTGRTAEELAKAEAAKKAGSKD